MTILALLFALAAGIWLIPLFRFGRIPLLATVVLIAGTVFGPNFMAIDAPIQITIDRLLWLSLFVVIAVRWRAGLLSLDQPHRIDWLLIGFAGWCLLSAVRGGPVPDGSSPASRWLFYVAMPIGMFAALRSSAIRESDLRRFSLGVLGLGTYLAVTAIFEVAGWHALVYPKYIVNSEAWEFFGRGRGPLMNPAGNGIVMSAALAISMLRMLASSRRGKFLYLAISLLLAGGVYATLTRSVWLGAAAVVAVIAIVHAPRWVRVWGLSTAMVLGGALALGLKDELLRLDRDKHLTAADAEKSVELRPLLAVVGWEMFKDRPILGHGFGHYFEHSGPYHNVRGYGMPLENARPYGQHNVLLSILVDTGLVGLTLLVAALAIFASLGWRLARDRLRSLETRRLGVVMLAMLATYLCNGMFQDVTIIPMVGMYLMTIAGLTVTVANGGLEDESHPVAVRASTERRETFA